MLSLSHLQRFKFKPLPSALLFSLFLSTDVYAACAAGVASGGSVCNSDATSLPGIAITGSGSKMNLSAPFVDIYTNSFRQLVVEISSTNGGSLSLNSGSINVYSNRTPGSRNRPVHAIYMNRGTVSMPNRMHVAGSLEINQEHGNGSAMWLDGAAQLLEIDDSLKVDTYADGIRNYGGTLLVKNNVDITTKAMAEFYTGFKDFVGGRTVIGGDLNIQTQDSPGLNVGGAIWLKNGTLDVAGTTKITGKMVGIRLEDIATPVVRLHDLIMDIAKQQAYAIRVRAGTLQTAPGSNSTINVTGDGSHGIIVTTHQGDSFEKGGRVSLGAEIVEDTHVLLAGNTTITTSGAGSHAVIIRTTGTDEVAKFAQDANASITTTGENSHALVITSDKGIDTTTGNMTAE